MKKSTKFPDITVGILGGGQLARMTVEAANRLNFKVAIAENQEDSPAGRISTFEIVGKWDDPAVLESLVQNCDVITLENEFVDSQVLQWLEARGLPVYPSALTLRLVQDKALQKQTLRGSGLPVPAFAAIETAADIEKFAGEYGWPLILKARRNGYDGKGNWKLDSAADIEIGMEKLGREGLMVEAFVDYRKELAVMVARRPGGETALYPVAPAEIAPSATEKAAEIARRAIEAIQGVGVFGVEMFLTGDGEVLINELAPRPHNSGHYTIEACPSSQFDNLLRAILDLPLGSTRLIAPAAMVNLLGENSRPGGPDGLPEALAVPGVNVHLYGKAAARPGRKMGHVTALAPNDGPQVALELAQKAAQKLIF